MSGTCTWVLAPENASSIRRRGRGGTRCQHRPGRLRGLDAVLAQVTSGQTMTVAELQRAAALLGRHVRSGRMDVLVARVRVAVQLEQLGA